MNTVILSGILLFLSTLLSYAQLTPGSVVSLKSNNGRYVSSENGANPMTATRQSIGSWERFTVAAEAGGTISLRGNNGRYVSSENGAQTGITCNRTAVGGWERFTVVDQGGGSFALQGVGGFMSSENGTRAMRCDRSSAGVQEVFTAEVQGGGSTPPPPANPPAGGTGPFRYDFGTPTSPVEGGFTRVTSTTSGGSFGWTNTAGLDVRDRGTNAGRNAITRDIVFSRETRVFRQALANGTYTVRISIGDQFAHDNIVVKAEGQTKASNIDRGVNQYEDVVFTQNVTDGVLNLEFSDSGGGSSPVWVVNSVVITQGGNGGDNPPPPPASGGISLQAEVNAANGNVANGLRNAIRKAGPNGRVNVNGTFNVNAPVVIDQPGITIDGNGTGVLRKNNNSNQRIFTIGNTSGVKFRGLTLEGPDNVNSITGFTALTNLDGAVDFSAVNCTFRRATLGFFARFKPTPGLVLDRCTFTDCREFAYLLVRDVVRINSANKVMAALNGGIHRITNCTFNGNFMDGISWDAGNDGTFTAANFPDQNNPLRAMVTERQTRLRNGNSGRSVYYGNNVVNSRRFGISLALVADLNIGGFETGQPNSFSMAPASGGSYAHCVHLEHTTIQVDVTNNQIDCRNNDGVVLEPFTDHGAVRGPAEGTSDIRIRNNRFTNTNNNARAVFANNHHRTTINNNTFTNFANGRRYATFQEPSDSTLSFSGNSPNQR